MTNRSDRQPGAVRDNIDRAGNDMAARALLDADQRDPGIAGVGPPIDPLTGEVRESGSGTGGGNAGEDHDDDHTAGSNTAK